MSLCTICHQQKRRGGRRSQVELSCGHTFHGKCISHWLCFHHMRCPLCQKNVDLRQENVRTISSCGEALLAQPGMRNRAEILNGLGEIMVRRKQHSLIFQGKIVTPQDLFLKAQRNDPRFVIVYLNLVIMWNKEDFKLPLKEIDSDKKVLKSRIEILGCAYHLAPNFVATIRLFISLMDKESGQKELLVRGYNMYKKEYICESLTKEKLWSKLASLEKKKRRERQR